MKTKELILGLKASKEKKLAVIGFPWDQNSSYLKGCAQAPPLIKEALYCDSSNLWTENGTNLSQSIFFEAYDFAFGKGTNPFNTIESAIQQVLNQSLLPIALGGDHSISYPAVLALSKKYSNINILHLDAHPDLYDEFEGNRLSNSCPFARIMESHLATRLVSAGIRTMNGHQQNQAEKFGVEVVQMKDGYAGKIFEFDSPLYISLDIDVLDPAFAPGVSHLEPGGMSVRKVIDILQNVKTPKIIGADIVEYNPTRDPSGQTAMVCAKFLKEIAARMLGNLNQPSAAGRQPQDIFIKNLNINKSDISC